MEAKHNHHHRIWKNAEERAQQMKTARSATEEVGRHHRENNEIIKETGFACMQGGCGKEGVGCK